MKMPATIMSMMMLSCFRVTEMIEREQLNLVSGNLLNRMQMKFHLSMCKACQRYQKHSQWVDTILQKYTTQTQRSSISEQDERVLKQRILKLTDAPKGDSP